LNYKDDEFDGEQFYYDEKGELVETEIYKSGILIEIIFNKD
jgi:antitoxin component YwqK of YwqJK toxin-antitoxin module